MRCCCIRTHAALAARTRAGAGLLAVTQRGAIVQLQGGRVRVLGAATAGPAAHNNNNNNNNTNTNTNIPRGNFNTTNSSTLRARQGITTMAIPTSPSMRPAWPCVCVRVCVYVRVHVCACACVCVCVCH
jgi:hypothetical protein